MATITLFQVSTLEGWTPIMYALQDCEGPIQIYFISFLMIISFLILNLMVGVICDAYSVVAEEDEDFEPPDEEQLGYCEIRQAEHERAAREGSATKFGLRRYCQTLVAMPQFESVIMVLVLVNTRMWAVVHDGMLHTVLEKLEMADLMFLGIYTFEMVVKLIDLWSITGFFSFSSNVFDFVITGASLASAVLKLAYSVDFNVTMLRALRLTRALRVTRSDSSKATAKLRVLFEELDDDGSGQLEAEEMSQLAFRLGVVLTEADLAEAMVEMDTDMSGEIDFDEFNQWFLRHAEESTALGSNSPRKGVSLLESILEDAYGS